MTNRGVDTGSSGTGGSSGASSVESRVLATLLTEMDGVLHTPGSASAALTADSHCEEYNDLVYVFATTNRLESIDAALLRKVSNEADSRHYVIDAMLLYVKDSLTSTFIHYTLSL